MKTNKKRQTNAMITDDGGLKITLGPKDVPWFRFLQASRATNSLNVGDRMHFWFDGWSPPPNCFVVAEVYPALWSRTFPSAGRTPDQQDAYATAEWLRRAGRDGSLEKFFCPELEPDERKVAEVEGWILGVV